MSKETSESLASLREHAKAFNITVDDILQVVAEYFNRRIEEIKSPSREAELVNARFMAYYLIRKFLGYGLLKTAQALNRTNHTTVMHAEQQMRKVYVKDYFWAQYMETLEDALITQAILKS